MADTLLIGVREKNWSLIRQCLWFETNKRNWHIFVNLVILLRWQTRNWVPTNVSIEFNHEKKTTIRANYSIDTYFI